MRIYLLNPPFVPRYSRSSRWAARGRGGALYYPIWLSYATGLLGKKGYSVKLVDAPARGLTCEDIKEDIMAFKPDLLVAESNFQSLSNDVKVTKELAKLVGCTSVLVGPPVSQYPDRILSAGIDIVAPFEYDFTLLNLTETIEAHADLRSVQGISFSKDGTIVHNPKRPLSGSQDLEDEPFVTGVYKKYLHLDDYFLNHAYSPMVQIITGRGCPNLCTFCSWPDTLTGRKYRTRSINNVVDEFEYIASELPEVKEVVIEDDTFTVNKKRVNEFCAEMKKREVDLPWSCQSRATLDYETIKAMKNVGCRLLDVGYESGNDEILKNIKKGVNREQLTTFTQDAKRAKIKVLADFVVGFPGETKDTIDETIQFIKEVKPDLLQVAVATPIPGTEFYRWAKDNGYLLIDDLEESLDDEGFQKCIISYPWLTKEEIESCVDQLLKEYYLSPSYFSVAAKNVLSKDCLHELQLLFTSAKVFLRYIGRKNEN